jgi:hypothetical protein
MTPTQVKRIVAALERGVAERTIAREEGIAEREVVRVRSGELDRRQRTLAAAGTAMATPLQAFRHMRGEIDTDFLDSLGATA